MKKVFILLLLVKMDGGGFAQNFCKEPDIAFQERLAHERLFDQQNLTGASTNFDVKYYRCEWEVDPAINYISGKVTVYYTILSSANSISFDLMSAFTVDSVKQRSVSLAKQHSNNVLQVNFSPAVTSGTFDSLSIFYKGAP